MTKTINRQPWTVRSIDYDDVGYRYFGYSDWKGKCTNKNFIGVDQETFEDCNNVYVDRDNVLRSRPAIKTAKQDAISGQVTYVWTFGPWTVYRRTNATGTTNTNLNFVYQGQSWAMDIVPVDCNVVLADEKIFVFGNNFAKYFDLVTRDVHDATDLIYSPITKLYTYGSEREAEKPNIWSKTHRERYIWSRETPTNLDKLIGKTVTIEVEGEEPKVIENFQKYQEYTIDKELYKDLAAEYLYLPIQSETSAGTITRAPISAAIPMIDVSRYNSVVRAKKLTKTVGSTSYTYYEIEYAIDGVNFSKLSDLPWDDAEPYNCYYIPKFSDDGTIIYLYTSKGVLAVSVLSESGDNNYRYITWTNICTTYEIPTSGTFTEYGCAHMSTYNTFSVWTGISGEASPQYAIYMVREGTLVSKANYFATSTVAFFAQKHSQCLCNTSNTIVCTTDILSRSDGSTRTQYAILIYSTVEEAPDIRYYTVGPETPVSIVYMPLRNIALYNSLTLSGVIAISDTLLYLFKYSDKFVDEKFTIDNTAPIVAEGDSSMLTASAYIYNKNLLPVESTYPIAVKNTYLYYGIYDSTTQKFTVRTTYIQDNITFTETVIDRDTVDYRFDCEAELSQYYISKGKTVYITSKGAYTNNDFDWYFSEEYAEHFDYEITALHPISTTEVAVFTGNSIYYIVPTTVTINEIERIAYQYYKSRIPLGCNTGSEVVTSYDGKYTIFSTKRGLVAMAYQDFVSSTEQALTFLSDNISQAYFDWNQGAVKLTLYKYWLIVYRLDTEIAFVYDMRNASWWPVTYAFVQQVVEIGEDLRLVSRNTVRYFDTGDIDYKDDFYGNISWSLKSQKLHFSAINYYKSINNITLSSVMDSLPDAGNPFTCNMRITTYRKIMDGTQAPETLNFYVDMIRTFVKKLNYMKIGQFQFEMLSDDDNVVRTPLSLTSITVKYKTTGQVR